MRHLNSKKKLNMKSSHRKAFIRNQAINFIRHGYIVTTVTKAKVVRSFAEKLITVAVKNNDFNGIRKLKSIIPYSLEAVYALISRASKYACPSGGYTRILKLGRRPSDTASMARLEWV